MNRTQETVQFICPWCNKRLKSPATNAGRSCRCPQCSTRMKIPGQPRALASRPVAPPARQEPVAVPVKIALLENLGVGMETTVLQDTADSMAKVVTGDFLVVLGLAVAAIFGFRPTSA